MILYRVFAAALAIECLPLIDSVSAWHGVVTFYSNNYHSGQEYPWGISVSQRCYNLGCFDNKASSVKWKGLPPMGAFESQSRLAVFTGPDCTGTSRDWSADGFISGEKDNYPVDFMIDGINDDVSSFMVWESSKKINNGIDTPCRMRRN